LRGGAFKDALQWLQEHFPAPLTGSDPPAPQKPALRLPPRHSPHLEGVRHYLIKQRALPCALIDSLIRSGSLYADQRANALFLLLGKGNQPVGAQLRGSGPVAWRGMAPGSRKELGFFSVPVLLPLSPPAATPPSIILCESAIDALSCFLLHPDHQCISTAGARPHPAWLPDLLPSGAIIFSGFDADPTADAMAEAMMARYPPIQRLRPSHQDWNDTLRAIR